MEFFGFMAILVAVGALLIWGVHSLFNEARKNQAAKVKKLQDAGFGPLSIPSLVMYPALNSIAEILKFLAVIDVIGGVIGGVLTFDISEAAVPIGIVIIVSSLISAIFCWAVAELIKVFTDISSGVNYLVRNSSTSPSSF
ncbi:MAG: hypothetical protein BWY18_00554 [Candidatus Cloacimonetes bacterium ADurb.Bin211]|nr:MAG: hypothetical protein BWY18_00554 [Candidatus Cloacimonetes bacterium ADurb.Bin211]